MSENLTASENFRLRMREVRERAGISQVALASRLAELGYGALKRDQIVAIEAGRRRVTLDDALAISAALGVAPVNLIVPFESDEPLSEQDMRALGYSEEDVSNPASAFFPPRASLEIGRELRLLPVEARPWIRGDELYVEAAADPEIEERYYVEQVPPATRHRWRLFARAHREGQRFQWYPLLEEQARRYAGRGAAKLQAKGLAALRAKDED